jgi:tetratricopeptide (TPR) repeat protein
MPLLFFILLVFGLCADSWAEQGDPVSPPLTTFPVTSSDEQVENQSELTFKSLAQMNELIELGVPALALSLLDAEQEKRPPFTVDWYTFEYKRILLLSALERWAQVVERTQWLFDTADSKRQITHKIALWFKTQQVMANIQLKNSVLALDQLQHLLWGTKAEHRDPSLPVIWRRLVIRVYLQMQKDDDARKALVKYEREYKTEETDIDWILLQAQVLLRTHRPEQALILLKKIATESAVDVEALSLIAQLQINPKSAEEINQQMREKLDGQILSRQARWAYSYIAYTASKLLSDQAAQIMNLESMLSMDIEQLVLDENYQVTADDLWELYNKQGLITANDHGLLFGNDEPWQQLSDKLTVADPQKALALNAALVLQPGNFLSRQQQHKAIVEIIEKRKNGLELINKLYLHSSKVKDVNVLPDEVRYRLVDYALSEGDYSDAATIMKSLKEPPEGKTLFDWRMRKARVLILQGEYKQSEALIYKTFSEKPKITRAELDRYIQVVFDFQTVQQHQQAIKLFDLLYIDNLDESLKREIYFWKAESYFSLENYDHAALYYLESARAVTGGNGDLWAQSARFKAGKSLILAGIYDDAENVYSDLLSITDSEARKALISQNLQKIRLLKSSLKKK